MQLRTSNDPKMAARFILAIAMCVGGFSTQAAHAQVAPQYRAPGESGGSWWGGSSWRTVRNAGSALTSGVKTLVRPERTPKPSVASQPVANPAPLNPVQPAPNAAHATMQQPVVRYPNSQPAAGATRMPIQPTRLVSHVSDTIFVRQPQSMQAAPGAILNQPTTITGPSAAACNCGYQTPPAACLGACQPCMKGFDCAGCNPAVPTWKKMYPIDFGPLGQGEYIGPPRLSHMREYRVRVGDSLQFAYVLSRDQMRNTYRLNVGDQLLIESLADEIVLKRGTFERGLEIQPDGTISVRILGTIHAAGLTIDQLRDLLEEKYKKYYKEPGIDVTPVKTNIQLDDIRNAIGGASGLNEQAVTRVVTPDGQIALPKIGAVCVQGLSLSEIKAEVNLRYQAVVTGLQVEVGLQEQATHFIAVLGEVGEPGRFEIESPTTVLTAIALAQGHNVGANLRQVVIFRRADDWRLISTVLDLRGAILGKAPLPTDEIFLRDGDVVIVPSSPIKLFDNFVAQVFTNGIYGIIPFQGFDLVEAVAGFEVDNNN